MLLSEAVSNSLSGGDESLLGGLLIAFTLIVLNLTVAYTTSHSKRMTDLIDGAAVLIGRDGKIFSKVLKDQRVGVNDVEQALREANCELSEMKCAFLESDGTISILK